MSRPAPVAPLKWTIPKRPLGAHMSIAGGLDLAVARSAAVGATALAFLLSLPLALYINLYKGRASKTAVWTRFFPDVLWGVPSIVYRSARR